MISVSGNSTLSSSVNPFKYSRVTRRVSFDKISFLTLFLCTMHGNISAAHSSSSTCGHSANAPSSTFSRQCLIFSRLKFQSPDKSPLHSFFVPFVSSSSSSFSFGKYFTNLAFTIALFKFLQFSSASGSIYSTESAIWIKFSDSPFLSNLPIMR